MQYQQGDVCIEIAALPKGAKKTDGNVVRDGETTGHAHRLVGDAEIFMHDGTMYFVVGGDGASLTHEEHKTQVFAKGTYKILPGVFEYDYDTEEAKRVID